MEEADNIILFSLAESGFSIASMQSIMNTEKLIPLVVNILLKIRADMIARGDNKNFIEAEALSTKLPKAMARRYQLIQTIVKYLKVLGIYILYIIYIQYPIYTIYIIYSN